ncbi:MAG: pyridoxal phosphate-dependent aminotransferase [Cytophagales bacterium]|nr:pyridoxal phosphate-dependent aminotransferase [Cytophagales bacterium]
MNNINTASSPLAERVLQMEESATIAMTQAARNLKATGADVISLSIGQPDFTTPTYIKEAAKKALDDGFTFYTPVPGFLDVREAIARKLVKENNIECTAENIAISTGAKQSIANVIMSLVNPSDEVIILTPYWVSYVEIVKFSKGKPVFVKGAIENDFKPTIEQIREAITPNTKAIMFSSPSNPTGATFNQEELEDLANLVLEYEDLYVLSDEIYEYITYEEMPVSLASIERVRDRVITINGFSKGFAMTGWRIGYICAPTSIVKACQKIQGQITSGTNAIAQKACIEALENEEAKQVAVEEMRQAYQRRRDLMKGLLDEIPNLKTIAPKGAFYLFPDVSAYLGTTTPDGEKIENTSDLCMYLLKNAHISVVTGAAFGAENNIRLSFAAADEQIVEAMRRMKEWLVKLK